MSVVLNQIEKENKKLMILTWEQVPFFFWDAIFGPVPEKK